MEKKFLSPAQVNIQDTDAIKQHFIALYDLHNLLQNGLEYEEWKFINLLKKAGYSWTRINSFRNYAARNTRYEKLIPSMESGRLH